MKGTQNYLYALKEGCFSFVLVYFQDKVLWVRRGDKLDGFFSKESKIKESKNIESILKYKSLSAHKVSFRLINK